MGEAGRCAECDWDGDGACPFHADEPLVPVSQPSEPGTVVSVAVKVERDPAPGWRGSGRAVGNGPQGTDARRAREGDTLMNWPKKKPPKPDPVVYLKRPRQVPASVHVYDDVLQDRTPEQNERLKAWWDETLARPGSAVEVRTMRHHEDDFAGRLADPPGSPAPTTIVDALDELIDKLKRERTP